LQKGGPWKGLLECVAAMISLLRQNWNILVLTYVGGQGGWEEIKTDGGFCCNFSGHIYLLFRDILVLTHCLSGLKQFFFMLSSS